jgi:hypothetical protein
MLVLWRHPDFEISRFFTGVEDFNSLPCYLPGIT